MNRTLEIGLGEYGITEIAGYSHHPRILKYFHEIGHEWVANDETAWCSAFANWIALKAGCYRSNKLNARSWLSVGQGVEVPKQGDVVVFWRENRSSWKGHVGFFISYSEDKKSIYVLGGNQNNKVCIKPYPTYRLLGFRSIDKSSFRPLIDDAA